MKVASVTNGEVVLDNKVIAAIVVLLGAIAPIVSTAATWAVERYKEDGKMSQAEQTADASRQAAEFERLRFALSLENENDRLRSLKLLLHTSLLRDAQGKLDTLKEGDLPRWPAAGSVTSEPADVTLPSRASAAKDGRVPSVSGRVPER